MTALKKNKRGHSREHSISHMQMSSKPSYFFIRRKLALTQGFQLLLILEQLFEGNGLEELIFLMLKEVYNLQKVK